MNPKTILRLALLGFVGLSLAYAVVARRDVSGDASIASPASATRVYYFHRTHRCPTCLGIEESAKTAVEEVFASELAAGRLAFSPANLDEPANAHFVEDFKLVMSSVVVARQQSDGRLRWAALDKAWDLADDPVRLRAYVVSEVRRFMDAE